MYPDPLKWSSSQMDLKPFVIKRQEHVICFGYPGYVKEWKYVAEYETHEEATEALRRMEAADPKVTYKIETNVRELSQWYYIKK